MDEHSFIRAIHRRLPATIYRLKLNVRFIRGVPDCWYSGDRGDLWVEFKYRAQAPTRQFDPGVSAHQRQWLTARQQEGRNVALIVGTPAGALIAEHGEWAAKARPPEQWLSIAEVVEWIAQKTSFTSTSRRPTTR